MKSEGWKTTKNNIDLLHYLLNKIADPKVRSVSELRSKLMKAGCALVDLDGDLVTLEKNLKRLTTPPAPQIL
jgi:hypothetical protein